MATEIVRVIVRDFNSIIRVQTPSSSLSQAGVTSVNGQVGAVVLNNTHVGAAATVHTHVIADVSGLQVALDGKASLSHTHSIANVTGLQTALDGKASTTHTHAISDTTGLQAAIDGKAALIHGHVIADITGLQAALDSKAVDSGLVHIAGTETITGVKTFSVVPAALQDPSAANDLTRKSWVDSAISTAISGLINSAPGTLDTLNELAAALGNDPNFATTITTSLSGKLSKSANLSDVTSVATARSNLGLGGAAVLNVGTSAGTVAAGNDARFTDSRTPTAHALSHATGGSDPVSPASIGASPVGHAHTAGDVSGLAAVATSGAYSSLTGTPTLGTAAALNVAPSGNASSTQVVKGDDTRLSDARTPTSHSHVIGDVTNLSSTLSSKADTATTISAGSGLTGGGSLAANRTLTVDFTSSGGNNGTATNVARGDHKHPVTLVAMGGIATLATKVYSARLPFDTNFVIESLTVSSATAGGANVNLQLKKDGANFGTAQTWTAGNTYQTFNLGYSATAGSIIQVEVASAVGGTPPTNVTFVLRCTI